MSVSRKYIYDMLCSVDPEADVIQGTTAQLTKLPAITFSLAGNQTKYTLDSEYIGSMTVYKIDIWTRDATQAEQLLQRTSDILCAEGWVMDSASDMPTAQDDLVHITSRFHGVIC